MQPCRHRAECISGDAIASIHFESRMVVAKSVESVSCRSTTWRRNTTTVQRAGGGCEWRHAGRSHAPDQDRDARGIAHDGGVERDQMRREAFQLDHR